MTNPISKPCTAFDGQRLLLSGPLAEVALAVKAAEHSQDKVLVFDDATGRVIDLDLRGSTADIIARLPRPSPSPGGRYRSGSDAPSAVCSTTAEAPEQRGRGRPKLGVVSREVTLLPRQWEWLAAQPGGASAFLRRLVDEARRNGVPRERRRASQEAAYHFMLAMAGDLPGYEDATRALFADDRAMLERCIAGWPGDIRAHALRLASGEKGQPAG